MELEHASSYPESPANSNISLPLSHETKLINLLTISHDNIIKICQHGLNTIDSFQMVQTYMLWSGEFL